jgi:hypothetical protein
MEIGNIQPLALCPSGVNPTSMSCSMFLLRTARSNKKKSMYSETDRSLSTNLSALSRRGSAVSVPFICRYVETRSTAFFSPLTAIAITFRCFARCLA